VKKNIYKEQSYKNIMETKTHKEQNKAIWLIKDGEEIIDSFRSKSLANFTLNKLKQVGYNYTLERDNQFRTKLRGIPSEQKS
jgi:hypothetical protein